MANSKKVLLNKKGVSETWENDLATSTEKNCIETIIKYADENHLENLIAIDNTANSEFVKNYIDLVENGFDLISSNKIANTLDYSFYKELRKKLKDNKKTYLYETNVGAGLPLIDTIKLLHDSGENITEMIDTLNVELQNIYKWLLSNRLSLNIEKTYSMLFTRNRSSIRLSKDIAIAGEKITKVESTKFLGIVIDSKLSWESHYNS